MPPVELPAGETVGDWQAAFVGQTGQLEKANDRTADTMHIVSTCEAMQATALKRDTRRKILGIF